jgi:hypothetical protein
MLTFARLSSLQPLCARPFLLGTLHKKHFRKASFNMADRTSVDVEGGTLDSMVQPRQRVQAAKKTMWHSLVSNPKVLFIAFFAS